MASQYSSMYPSINPICVCKNKHGIFTKLGKRQYEYESLLKERPNATEALRRLGIKWSQLGLEPASFNSVSQDVIDKFIITRDDILADELLNQLKRKTEYEKIMQNGRLLPIEAINRMKLKRMCCREAFLNQPMISFIDRSSNSYYDVSFSQNPIIKDDEVPMPKRYVPPFPSFD